MKYPPFCRILRSNGNWYYKQLNVHYSKPSSLVNRKTYETNNLRSENKESVYYFEDGLRKVYPFYYQFNTSCKRRWINRNIVDVFCNENAMFPIEEIKNKIAQGLVEVNNKVVDIHYVLRKDDLISTLSHRHELAVLACPIKILSENDEFLVVDKPPSMPVHPCGLYVNNSVLSILSNEYDKNELHIIYRLDRLTSGVLLLAKSSKKAWELNKQMRKQSIKKEYVCRVEGNFPDGSVVCNEPVKQFHNGIGVSVVHPSGKIAVTEFKKLSYNGESSVVLCKPYTGRTHQIRVHLQYLGHPIINDPVYNSFVFGPFKGKSGIMGKTVDELMEDLLKEHSSKWEFQNNSTTKHISDEKDFLTFLIFKKYYFMNEELPVHRKDISRLTNDDNCYFCNTANHDPQPSSLGMFLHALKYGTDSWMFESNMPFWAHEDWNITKYRGQL